ncbi:MAG: conjugal transfer protein TraD [Aliidongia sp.]
MKKPRDIDSELKALQERARELKIRRTMQLGELVAATGADTLTVEAIAGILLAALDQARDKPEAVARWTERGQTFFQTGRKSGKRSKGAAGQEEATAPASGTPGSGSPAEEAGGSLR